MNKNRIKLIVCTLAVLFPAASVHSTGVVTDPISYTYYVEQIAKATEYVNQMKRSVDTLGGIKDEVNNMKNMFKGSYNNTVGLVESLGNLKHEIVTVPDAVEQSTVGYANNTNKEFERYQKVDKALEDAFNDPRSAHYNPWVLTDYQYNMKQLSRKNTIRYSSNLLQGMDKRVKNIDKLSDDLATIDSRDDVKDAIDLTNRLLVELIKGNTELLAITTRLAEMNAMDGYAGVEGEEIAKTKGKKKPVEESEWMKETRKIAKENAWKYGLD